MATKLRSFYRPHQRVYAPVGIEKYDLKTGEVKIEIEPSRTKQSFVEECDINNILKQYQKTGQIRHITAQAEKGQYVDLPEPIDFQESLNTVMRAEEAFATLPAKLRNRFGNDPSEFLEFMGDPANQDEIIKLGLAKDLRVPDPAAPNLAAVSGVDGTGAKSSQQGGNGPVDDKKSGAGQSPA